MFGVFWLDDCMTGWMAAITAVMIGFDLNELVSLLHKVSLGNRLLYFL